MDALAVGEMVLYRVQYDTWPAVVTAVLEGEHVCLTVFPRNNAPFWLQNVPPGDKPETFKRRA